VIKNPFLTIGICVYFADRVEILRQAVDSCLSQDFFDIEILIVKDGEVTAEVDAYLNLLPELDFRVRVIGYKNNRGLGYALNFAVKNSCSPFFARMDSDDISHINRIRSQLDFLISHSEVDIVGAFAIEFDDCLNERVLKTMPIDYRYIIRFQAYRDAFIHPTVVFRREFFGKYGYYNESPAYSSVQDTELWCRALTLGCIAYNLSVPLLDFRVNSLFYSRRVGLKMAWMEFWIRWRYIFKNKLSLHLAFLAFLVCLVRLLPPVCVKLIYKFR
jgi:glycosyltransferase involved in cell wall biosynthesis